MHRTFTVKRTIDPRTDADRIFDVRTQEIARQVLRREVRVHGGARGLAREVRVNRGSLRKFMTGQSTPEPRTFGLICDFAADRPEPTVPLSLVALALLVDDVKPEHRPRARRDIAAIMKVIYADSGEGAPTWVEDEIAENAISEAAQAVATTRVTSERKVIDGIRRLLEELDFDDDE
jgi:hypothetical protein